MADVRDPTCREPVHVRDYALQRDPPVAPGEEPKLCLYAVQTFRRTADPSVEQEANRGMSVP